MLLDAAGCCCTLLDVAGCFWIMQDAAGYCCILLDTAFPPEICEGFEFNGEVECGVKVSKHLGMYQLLHACVRGSMLDTVAAYC